MRLSHSALILALLALLVTALLLGQTRLGLSIKAVGHNPVAAVLYGLRPDRLMLVAMLSAGGFAALSGYFQVTAVYHRLIPNNSSNYGWL